MVDACNCRKTFGLGIGQPTMPVPSRAITNENGFATIVFNAVDPKNNRSYIDGQIYSFIYSIEGQNKKCWDLCTADKYSLLNSLFVIRVFDRFESKGLEPTWLDDIYPIFKQYADLYPVMTKNFLNLGNYYDVLKYRSTIKMSMELPESHPNYMPVTRDLSKSKREVILQWLSNKNLVIGEPKKYYSIKNLRRDLQTALELEHATIPVYLTALASIKPNYNLEIQAIINTIVVQEMMHVLLVANILNAVGGAPSLYSEDFIPNYPSRLPGGVQPDLVVPLKKLSHGLIRNIFMKIEEPEQEQERILSFQHAFLHARETKDMMKSKAGHQQSGNARGHTIARGAVVSDDGLTDPLIDEDRSSACFTSSSREQFFKGKSKKYM